MVELLKNNLFATHSFAAATPVAFGIALSYPLDTLKVLVQAGSSSNKHLTPAQVFDRVRKFSGISVSLAAGFSGSIAVAASYSFDTAKTHSQCVMLPKYVSMERKIFKWTWPGKRCERLTGIYPSDRNVLSHGIWLRTARCGIASFVPCKTHFYSSLKPIIHTEFHCTDSFSMKKVTHLCTTAALLKDPSSLVKPASSKSRKKARREAPENLLRHKLDQCSKRSDLKEALRLYDEARVNNVPLNVHHYNILLYLCSVGTGSGDEDGSVEGNIELGLERGFEIFKQMGLDKVAPNEATFTNVARLAAAKEDPEMAFELVKQMKSSRIIPKLRSYGPALFGFCTKIMAGKAYEVDAHMIENGVLAEEPELLALLRLSSEAKRPDKVYEMMHRMRATVRQVSEETAEVVEDWFRSKSAAEVGKENWDVRKLKEGVINGGGGWHGQGWLGKGKWRVARTEMDQSGRCRSCGEKLVSIDIDPKETENFAKSLSKLACEREVRTDFLQFQEWLSQHGPFDAVVDGANVSILNQRTFSFQQLKLVVNQLYQMSPSKRLPLVILHRSRVTSGPALHPNNKKLLESWKKAGSLYVTPPGSNDDWYWLFAAVSSKCLLVTNDEMRDHLFQLLGTSFFPRWKEKHQIRLTPAKPGLNFHMPPPYSIVFQESEQGNWHVPTVTGDDLEAPRQWVCATRSKNLHSLFL